MANEEELKMYVWEDVLCDYSCGVMFALAHNVDEARREVLKSFGCSEDADPRRSVDASMQRIDDVIQSPESRKLRRRLFDDEVALVGVPQCIISPEGFHVTGGA